MCTVGLPPCVGVRASLSLSLFLSLARSFSRSLSLSLPLSADRFILSSAQFLAMISTHADGSFVSILLFTGFNMETDVGIDAGSVPVWIRSGFSEGCSRFAVWRRFGSFTLGQGSGGGFQQMPQTDSSALSSLLCHSFICSVIHCGDLTLRAMAALREPGFSRRAACDGQPGRCSGVSDGAVLPLRFPSEDWIW